MNNRLCLLPLMAAMAGPAQGQPGLTVYAPAWSDSALSIAQPRKRASAALVGQAVPASAPDMPTGAWVMGAHTALGSGSAQFGYERQQGYEGLPTRRQLSIGYAYPLANKLLVFADARSRKAGSTVRQFDIGVSASF